jgi:hypothetical protein
MTAIRLEPLHTPATWRRDDLLASDDWTHRLTPEQVADLERALAAARRTGRPLGQLAREDFPLPVLGPVLADWMEALQRGRGFLNVKGIPVQRCGDDDVALLHWGLGLQLGTAVSQNAAGDLLHNAVLHARTAFEDWDEPERKRHMVRLWLTAHGDWADGDAFVRQGIPKKAGVVSDAEAIVATAAGD